MKKCVIFGAGNIGRSFVAQVFSRHAYEIVFVDIDTEMVDALNAQRRYEVLSLHPDGVEERYEVSPVRAVHGGDEAAVLRELLSADLAATSVGQGALPHIAKVLGKAALLRAEQGMSPLDVLLAENIREGAQCLTAWVLEGVPAFGGVPERVAETLGFVETSIGKMVPLQERALDLVVRCEPYNTLIVDALGFHQEVPAFAELKAVEQISAWVDRKLFVHNLGHAAAAYIIRSRNPEENELWRGLQDPYVEWKVRTVMRESAWILARVYPEAYSFSELEEHIADLLSRFKNPHLGDTVERVGRDLKRKLHKSDRLLGAVRLGVSQGFPVSNVLDVFLMACEFEKHSTLSIASLDENRSKLKLELSTSDREVYDDYLTLGPRGVMKRWGGLDDEDPIDAQILKLFTYSRTA